MWKIYITTSARNINPKNLQNGNHKLLMEVDVPIFPNVGSRIIDHGLECYDLCDFSVQNVTWYIEDKAILLSGELRRIAF